MKAMLASEIAALVGSELFGEDIVLSNVCTLDSPRPNALGFARKATPEQEELIATIRSCVFLVPEEQAGAFPCAHIPVGNPRLAFATAVTQMRGSPVDGIHVSAVIDSTARIGEGTVIYPGVVIGPSVQIGRNCIIKSNTVIGQEGFGIAQDENGNNFRLPHVGGVVIGDNVELGALNTVCAGTIEPTKVDDFVKTDDHVHIAHNVRVGSNSILTACVEISGSVDIGPRSWLGPNCSIINGISLGRGVFVGIGAVVTKSLPDRAVVAGNPARILRIDLHDAVRGS